MNINKKVEIKRQIESFKMHNITMILTQTR